MNVLIDGLDKVMLAGESGVDNNVAASLSVTINEACHYRTYVEPQSIQITP
jgi:hypothetical protein